ncbi:chitinase, putative, partial [Ixodes scapularis]
MRALTLALAVACTALLQQSQVQGRFWGCPPVDLKDDNVTYIPNPFNCSTFFQCVQGTPVLMECPPGLHFNELLNVCDWQWRAQCTELPRPPAIRPRPKIITPEETTTTAPEPEDVQTEKIIIKKVVKEIIRPTDPQTASETGHVSEPPKEPAVEPVKEPATEPSIEPPAKSEKEPAGDPAKEPAAEPAEGPAAEPAKKPAAEPAEEPSAEPAVEPAAEPAAEPAVEPAAEPAVEPASQPATEPAVEPAAEPASEPAGEPAA